MYFETKEPSKSYTKCKKHECLALNTGKREVEVVNTFRIVIIKGLNAPAHPLSTSAWKTNSLETVYPFMYSCLFFAIRTNGIYNSFSASVLDKESSC